MAAGFLAGTRGQAQTNLTGTGYLNIGAQNARGTTAGDATVGHTLVITNTQPNDSDWAFENVGRELKIGYGYVGSYGSPIKFLSRGNWPYTLDVAIPGSTTIGGTLYVGTQVDANSVPLTAMNSLKLAVDGPIGARSAVYVRALGIAWPDYVFAPAYQLRSLPETARYIRANGHLPDVPAAAEVAQTGLELAAMDALLLRKVEELTLHLIALQRENEALQARLQQLEAAAKPAVGK